MKMKRKLLGLLLGILVVLVLTGCSTSQDAPATTETVTEAATVAQTTEAATVAQTTEAATVAQTAEPSEAVPETQISDIDAAAEGYRRISLGNEAFRNYEIWQHLQDGSLHFVSLKELQKLSIVPIDLYNSSSGEAFTTYSIQLLNELYPQLYGHYLPHFTLSFADRDSGYCAVDFGGKVDGLYGFSCNFAVTPYDSALSEECEWYLLPLGSMYSSDFLGYIQVPVEYSELDQAADAPNSADYLNTVTDEIAGFVVMPMELGAFSVNYDSVILYFDSLEHLSEYLVLQWESFEAP